MNGKNEAELREKLAAFLSDAQHRVRFHRAWIHTPDLSVYVRVGLHYVEGGVLPCFDLASVEVQNKRQGMFKKLLAISKELLRDSPYTALFLENVLAPELDHYLSKLMIEDNRWVRRCDGAGLPPSYFWIKNKSRQKEKSDVESHDDAGVEANTVSDTAPSDPQVGG